MPPVPLSLLRPQVNVLMSHYGDEALFGKTLLHIFEKYSEKTNPADTLRRLDPDLPAYNLPPIVLNELEMSLEKIARDQPAQAVKLADVMWAQHYYEPRKLAIFVMSHLPAEYEGEFITHVQDWFAEGINESLITEFITQSNQKLEIITSPAWFNLLQSWIASEDRRLQKIGMQAIGDLASNRSFQNLPKIFDLITPLYSQPDIALQRNLTELTRRLIERSEPETASFLISMVEVNRKPAVSALVRKLMPLFDEYYQADIHKAVFPR